MSRINIDPAVCHGKPVIQGTRILVSNILADLAVGRNFQQISQDYPGVKAEDIQAVLEFSAELAAFETIHLSTAV
jgi:uncharacterized protein (DUF433 family)